MTLKIANKNAAMNVWMNPFDNTPIWKVVDEEHLPTNT